MRIWTSIPPERLCRKHLLGEHVELHALWAILDKQSRGLKYGYRNHPETLRWIGHAPALAARHELQVAELQRRGYKHNSPLPQINGDALAGSSEVPPDWDDQELALAQKVWEKDCDCRCSTLLFTRILLGKLPRSKDEERKKIAS